MSGPLVSVIIPVYNCERYLAQSIDSVLNQTYPNLETIVIDDGSTDKSPSIVKSFGPKVRLLSQPNRGIGSARNLGINNANGDFFAFHDADDLMEKKRIEKQIKIFKENTGVDIVFGCVKQFFDPDIDQEIKRNKFCPDQIMVGKVAGTLLVKRNSFFRVGFFGTHWKTGEFIDWYSKAKECELRDEVINDVVLFRRIHANNQGIRENRSKSDYIQALKASLDRRRKIN